MWRKGKVVSTLFLDVKSTFPSMMLGQLLGDMRMRGMPAEYTEWIRCKVTGRTTTLSFDGYKLEPIALSRGIDQGCPLSGILFQFYNTDLIYICGPRGDESAVTFVDDTLLLACSKTLSKANETVKQMMEWLGRGLDWSHLHHCDFTMDKFGGMGLTLRREPNPAKRPPTRPTHRHPLFL